MIKALCVFLPVFCSVLARSQSIAEFRWPLDTPCVITGNYGELRPNHFHAGIDLSTGGRINRPVYCAQDGYISRIRISAAGYGKCVYITHPGKKVTVYAHLNSLALKVAKVVKEEQMARQSFEVELLPAPGAMPVKKGEIIGLSGNSGGSQAPHLHFEIRDEVSETPLNPLEYYTIRDKVPPVLEAVGFYDLADTLNPFLVRSTRIHPATVSQTFVVQQNPLGFAFMGYDQMVANGNRNNVYVAELYLDGSLVYRHHLRAIDFSDNRYVNEFSETAGRLRLQKCFVPTSYPPRFYDFYVNKGILSFADTLSHALKLVLMDENRNQHTREFGIRCTGTYSVKSQVMTDSLFMDCARDFYYKGQDLQLYIPAGTFYRSAQLRIDNRLNTTSRILIEPPANLRTAMVLGCKVPPNYSEVPGKLVLRSAGGVVTGVSRNDSVFFYLKNTGNFYLLADLEPPAIRTALSPKRLKKIRQFSSFSFVIADKLSGMSKYSVTVNNQWVIAEYDAKSDMLTYFFDDNTPKGPLDFVVQAEDRSGNRRKFTYRLMR